MRFFLLVVVCIVIPVTLVAEELLQFDGLIEPKELVDFSSHVPGILKEVLVERGDWVKRGQVLARLDSRVEKAVVNSVKAKLDFSKRKLERNQRLYEKQMVAAYQQDEMQTAILMAKLELQEARERLNLKTIRSTVDGVVVEREGFPGEYVGENPFLTVAKVDLLSVELVVPVTYYGMIEVGNIGTIRLNNPVGGVYQAKILSVDTVIDAASDTFGVRLELPNPDRKLPAGLKCQVTF